MSNDLRISDLLDEIHMITPRGECMHVSVQDARGMARELDRLCDRITRERERDPRSKMIYDCEHKIIRLVDEAGRQFNHPNSPEWRVLENRMRLRLAFERSWGAEDKELWEAAGLTFDEYAACVRANFAEGEARKFHEK